MLTNVKQVDLTIAVGQTNSNVVNGVYATENAEAVYISAPAALDAGTYTLETNPDPLATNATAGWTTLQIGDPAADASPPAASKARVYYELSACPSWRIKGPAAVGVDRVFKVSISEYA